MIFAKHALPIALLLATAAARSTARAATTNPVAQTTVAMQAASSGDPLLSCKELYIVEVVSATPPVEVHRKDPDAWPARETRRTVRFSVKEVLLGPRKVGDQFDYPTVAYNIQGSDRPTTPWDDVQFDPGRQFLFAPGGTLEWNKKLPGIHEVPSILEETPSHVPPTWNPFHPPNLEDIRALIAIRQLPRDQQGAALRKRLAANAISESTAIAARNLFALSPDRVANIQAIVAFVLRPDIGNDVRRDWVWFLQDMLIPGQRDDPGNREIIAGFWRLLARGTPPEGEDIRVDLQPAVALTRIIYPAGGFSNDGTWYPGYQWEKYYIPIDQFVPKDIDMKKVRQALAYLRDHDPTNYDFGGHMLHHDPTLDGLTHYLDLGPAGATTAPAIPPTEN